MALSAPASSYIDTKLGSVDNKLQGGYLDTSGIAAQPFTLGNFGNSLVGEFFKATTRQASNILVNRGGTLDWGQVAGDAFGNGIGNSIAGQIKYDRLVKQSAIKLEISDLPNTQGATKNSTSPHIVTYPPVIEDRVVGQPLASEEMAGRLIKTGSSAKATNIGNESVDIPLADFGLEDLRNVGGYEYTPSGRRVEGKLEFLDGTTVLVESDVDFERRSLKEADSLLRAYDDAIEASLSDKAPSRERGDLWVYGGSLRIDVLGERFGLEWNSKNGFGISVGNKAISVGLDQEGKPTIEAGMKIKVDLGSGVSQISVPIGGLLSVGADQDGMIRLSAGYRGIGVQGGFNPIEGAMRIVDPAVNEFNTLAFLLSNMAVRTEIARLRQEVAVKLETLRDVPSVPIVYRAPSLDHRYY